MIHVSSLLLLLLFFGILVITTEEVSRICVVTCKMFSVPMCHTIIVKSSVVMFIRQEVYKPDIYVEVTNSIFYNKSYSLSLSFSTIFLGFPESYG